MNSGEQHTKLDYNDFTQIIDNLYDEIWVYDDNYNVVYVNEACKRHYNLNPDDIVGNNFFKMLDEKLWYPSVLPYVYKNKKLYAIKQMTRLGTELINIANPIFDDNGNIKYVAMSVRDIIDESMLIQQRMDTQDEMNHDMNFMISKSESMQSVLKLAQKIGKVDSSCLITGESGTGKSRLARYIHNCSDRKDKPYISINCSAIPNELIESELFGYKSGAFTGAKSNGKIGLLESANHGTILLDEIAELPYTAQSKLLQVIQEKEFIPIGSVEAQKLDIKIIAATNRDLNKLIANGSFREDLYYRLNTFEIYIPPLRDRAEDIEELIFYYLNFFANKYNMHHELQKEVVSILKSYIWKGNVRELSSVIERMVVTSDDIIITKKDLPTNLFTYDDTDYLPTSSISSFDDAINKYEKKLITDAYKKYKTTRKIAAALDISQTKASNLIRKYITNSNS